MWGSLKALGPDLYHGISASCFGENLSSILLPEGFTALGHGCWNTWRPQMNKDFIYFLLEREMRQRWWVFPLHCGSSTRGPWTIVFLGTIDNVCELQPSNSGFIWYAVLFFLFIIRFQRNIPYKQNQSQKSKRLICNCVFVIILSTAIAK